MKDNLIEIIAKLKEMEQNRRFGSWAEQMNAGSRFVRETMDAAPKFLDVLGEIRVGDAVIIENFLKEDCVFGEVKEVLQRYSNMARKMEEIR
jgi:hypothetical protein